MCIGVSTPLFLAKPPLNVQTVQAPIKIATQEPYKAGKIFHNSCSAARTYDLVLNGFQRNLFPKLRKKGCSVEISAVTLVVEINASFYEISVTWSE